MWRCTDNVAMPLREPLCRTGGHLEWLVIKRKPRTIVTSVRGHFALPLPMLCVRQGGYYMLDDMDVKSEASVRQHLAKYTAKELERKQA